MKSSAWPAPRARTPVHASVVIPGSKSITNRALILAALADGPSRVREPLAARDSELMINALRSLGTQIDEVDGDLAITPAAFAGPAQIDCGLAGTVMRFVPAVAALASGPVTFDGDPRARERPMGPVIDALRQLGVEVEVGDRLCLPFTLHGRGVVTGSDVTIDASASSQFVSALLLAGARYDRGLTIQHRGAAVPSMPHIEMTLAMLRERGVRVESDVRDPANARWQVEPGPIMPLTVTVEPDLSNAAPFLAAAAVTGGSVTVSGWPHHTTQAGDALRELLASMGCTVTLGDQGRTVSGPERLTGIDVDLHEDGEMAPVIAALAARADSPSTLRGIGHLRGHETDRLAALESDLHGVGVDVQQRDDGLVIRPPVALSDLHGSVWASHDDHRMATAGAVVGLVVDDVVVDDIATTAKTLPDFVQRWDALLGGNTT